MAASEGQKKIYFAGAIRGGRDDADIYLQIVGGNEAVRCSRNTSEIQH